MPVRGDYMDENIAGDKEVKLLSKMPPGYRLEFINGAICNITARGEIVCDFHFESRDRPTEQLLKVAEDGTIIESKFQETGIYTREIRCGIVMNAAFARDLITLLSGKIKEAEESIEERARRDLKK